MRNALVEAIDELESKAVVAIGALFCQIGAEILEAVDELNDENPLIAESLLTELSSRLESISIGCRDILTERLEKGQA